MKPEDKLIQDFFQKIKGKDKHVVIPLPPDMNDAKKYKWLPIAIAASLLLLLVSYFYPTTEPIMDYTINIKFESNKSNITESLINQTISIDSWESSTQSLLEDF